MTASGYTLAQERALAINPKIMASFSMPSSMFIIYEVFCDHQTRGTTPVQRALVGMSLVDILASSAWFMSTWAVPKGSFAFSAGNRTTCNYQGFLLQLAIGAPLYNSSLALFYLLMIKQRWSDQRLIKVERWVHAFIISFTIGTSILLLQLEQYNHIGAVCWVIGEPAGCGHSSFQGSDIPCDRGDYAWAWGLALFYGPLWVCVIACVISMVILYLEVRETHRRSMRHSREFGLTNTLNRSGSDSNRVAVQAMLYSLSFLITWMPSTLWSIAHWFNWSHDGLDIAAATAEPLQGFWNLLIFLMSRPNSVLKIRKVLARAFPCIFSPPPDDMRVSFATGLRSKSRSPSCLSGALSTTALADSGREDLKKPMPRNTATTEALDDIKSLNDSIHRRDHDASAFEVDMNVKDLGEGLSLDAAEGSDVSRPGVNLQLDSSGENHHSVVNIAPTSEDEEDLEDKLETFEVGWA